MQDQLPLVETVAVTPFVGDRGAFDGKGFVWVTLRQDMSAGGAGKQFGLVLTEDQAKRLIDKLTQAWIDLAGWDSKPV